MTAPLRVLHLNSGNLFGGIETALVALAQLRDACPGMVSAFGLCFDGQLGDELAAAEAAVHRLGPVRFSRPWTVWAARRRLRRLLGREPFDVAVVHGSWSHALFTPTARRCGVPVVYWAHGAAPRGHWLERLAARTTPDLVLANSRATAAAAAELFPAVRIEVQPPPYRPAPPADAGSRDLLRAGFGVPDGAVVVLSVSRMEPLKGHAVLLDALGRLPTGDGWRCWVAGGAQRPEEQAYAAGLVRAAAAAGLADRVAFLGHRRDVPALLAAADVYCQPNTGPEGFGLTFVEAMTAGLPVVTSNIGGAQDIVTDATGILTPPGDAAGVAAALRRLIADPGLRRSLGAAGRERAVAVFSPGALMTRLHELLGSVGRPGISRVARA